MEIFIPSLVSMVIPAYILSLSLKGNLVAQQETAILEESDGLSAGQRKIIFFLGVGGLIFVPIFKTITHLPPFVGILLVLGVLWTVTEIFYCSIHQESEDTANNTNTQKRETIGVLTMLGQSLDVAFEGNHYLVTGIIGVLSSIVDNVPLVAGCMGMYPVQAAGDMAVDGIFWQLLAYCAGVGGSMLIIGSAAGVVVMGLEKITFGWYMKKITWIAFVGYLAGIVCYWLEKTFLF